MAVIPNTSGPKLKIRKMGDFQIRRSGDRYAPMFFVEPIDGFRAIAVFSTLKEARAFVISRQTKKGG